MTSPNTPVESSTGNGGSGANPEALWWHHPDVIEGIVPATDADLASSAWAGDKSAFSNLVVRHRPTAPGLAQRMLFDADLASDAVQEATVIALVSLDRLRSPERFGAWLCGITLNVARRWLRERQPSRPFRPGTDDTGSLEAGPDEAAEAAEMARRVRVAVSALAQGQRQAVLLFYWQGLTHAEVAAELDISVGAVKARLHQARAALQPRLAEPTDPQEVPSVPAKLQSPQRVEMSVAEVRRDGGDDPTRRAHVVLLEERDGGRRLPIWAGPGEATALAMTLEAEEMPRPMTYQLAFNLLTAADSQITEVRVTRLADGTFYALVRTDTNGKATEVDARPSDGLNLALVAGAPIRVDASLLDDPAAVGHTEWQEYPTGAGDLVAGVRRRQAEIEAKRVQKREDDR